MNYSGKYPPSWAGAYLAALRPAPGKTLKAQRDALVVERSLANFAQGLRDAGMCAAAADRATAEERARWALLLADVEKQGERIAKLEKHNEMERARRQPR